MKLPSTLTLLIMSFAGFTGLQAGQSNPSSSNANYADKFITVNGLRLHYLDWGNESKPPFIMLHGISRVAHQFDHIAPHFRDNCSGPRFLDTKTALS